MMSPGQDTLPGPCNVQTMTVRYLLGTLTLRGSCQLHEAIISHCNRRYRNCRSRNCRCRSYSCCSCHSHTHLIHL